ncbi:MAG: glycosyltransferase family 4 protein [Isosphaeraceae bacterium]
MAVGSIVVGSEVSMIRRVLFVSFASYLDDANGASVASRAMLEALVRRGFAVEILCGPILELNRQIDLASSLAARGLSVDLRGSDTGDVGARSVTPDHLRIDFKGVPVTILAGSALPRAPDDEECRAFVRLFEQVWAGFQPEVVVSYGGGWLTREVLRRAKARGAATVFPLHNLRYHDPAPFVDVDAVLVASHFAAEHYRRTLGLRCTVLPNLVDRQRVRALERQPACVVFVNPTIEKGVGVFARIADELGRRRPDVPFLVVEGKGTEADVAACGLDLRAHGNVFFHEHTNDPRRFWRLAKVCLLPSLVPENQPLVAIEAMINGVPVLGSDRGGIPETLGKAGAILPIPPHLTPSSFLLPTSDEIAPWVEAILELWDSPDVYEQRSHEALIEAQRWRPDLLEPRYERFFATVGRKRGE